jgi:hypothetical protein
VDKPGEQQRRRRWASGQKKRDIRQGISLELLAMALGQHKAEVAGEKFDDRFGSLKARLPWLSSLTESSEALSDRVAPTVTATEGGVDGFSSGLLPRRARKRAVAARIRLRMRGLVLRIWGESRSPARLQAWGGGYGESRLRLAFSDEERGDQAREGENGKGFLPSAATMLPRGTIFPAAQRLWIDV